MKNEIMLQNIADFENKSLLFVDDDNPFRERLARAMEKKGFEVIQACLLYTSPSPRDGLLSRMPSSA